MIYANEEQETTNSETNSGSEENKTDSGECTEIKDTHPRV